MKPDINISFITIPPRLFLLPDKNVSIFSDVSKLTINGGISSANNDTFYAIATIVGTAFGAIAVIWNLNQIVEITIKYLLPSRLLFKAGDLKEFQAEQQRLGKLKDKITTILSESKINRRALKSVLNELRYNAKPDAIIYYDVVSKCLESENNEPVLVAGLKALEISLMNKSTLTYETVFFGSVLTLCGFFGGYRVCARNY